MTSEGGSDRPTAFVRPATDGLAGRVNAALAEQILYITQAQVNR